MNKENVTISKAEYDRLVDYVRGSDQQQAMEIAALEKRYQEQISRLENDKLKLEEAAQMHEAEMKRLEAIVLQKDEKMKEMQCLETTDK